MLHRLLQMGFCRQSKAPEGDSSVPARQWGRRALALVLAGLGIWILEGLWGYGQVSRLSEGRGREVEPEGQSEEPVLSGTLQIFGSTSMDRVMNALAQSFVEKYPQVTVVIIPAGSSAGIEAVLSGSAHIGCSSRELTEEEKAAGAVEQILALDGLAVCVEASCGITELTGGQLAELYTGAVRNWSRLGGSDLPVVLVGREAGSGTREAFERLLSLTDLCTYANELNSTGAVLARVASVTGAVGYVSFDGLDGSVTVVTLDGVEASPENVISGAYPLSRPLVMVTKGELSGQEQIVQAWFGFALGKEGQSIVEETGLIPVQEP